MSFPWRRTPRRDSDDSDSNLSLDTLQLLQEITCSGVRLTPAASENLSQHALPVSTFSLSATVRSLLTTSALERSGDVPELYHSTSSTSSPTGSTVVLRHLSSVSRAEGLASPLTMTKEGRTSLPSDLGVAPLMSSDSSESLCVSPKELRPSSDESPVIVRRYRRSITKPLREILTSAVETATVAESLPRSGGSESCSLPSSEESQSPRRKSRRTSLFVVSPTVEEKSAARVGTPAISETPPPPLSSGSEVSSPYVPEGRCLSPRRRSRRNSLFVESLIVQDTPSPNPRVEIPPTFESLPLSSDSEISSLPAPDVESHLSSRRKSSLFVASPLAQDTTSPSVESPPTHATLPLSSDSELSSIVLPASVEISHRSPHRKSSLFVASPLPQGGRRRSSNGVSNRRLHLSSPQPHSTPSPSSRLSLTSVPSRSVASSRGSGSESSIDSLTRLLLQPPTPASSCSASSIAELGNVSSPKEVFPERRASSSVSDEQLASPRRKSNRRSRGHSSTAHSATTDYSPEAREPSSFERFASYVDATMTLFSMRHRSPPAMRKPLKKKPPYSIAVDPQIIGECAYSAALRDGAQLDQQLKTDAKSIEWILGARKRCKCDVRRHPGSWSRNTINNVHKYSFLLNCQELRMQTHRMIALNKRKTIIVYEVNMVDGNPWKKKAEHVLRFVDMELDVGDQTAFNCLYYVQPCDRQILLVIIMDRVMGLLVAEKQSIAHRPHIETVQYRELEDTPVPVRVGINLLWIHVSLRRYGLATRLCNIVRRLFYYPEVLKNEDFAFNDVSEMGMKFARSFLGISKVPLYYGKPGK